MSHEELFEVAPLAALGVLEPALERAFGDHAASCAACRRELDSYGPALAGLARCLPTPRPRPALRERLLAGLPARPRRPSPWRAALPLAAALLLALALRAHQRAVQAEGRSADLAEALAAQQEQTARLAQDLAEAAGVSRLLTRREARLVSLGGQPAAPDAQARVVFHPETCEAVLVVSGLAAAPAGHVYEVWVIAGPVPVAAGTFQADGKGEARVRLPVLPETARVQTFAVTLEPAGGRPAPSGPLVLAGTVS